MKPTDQTPLTALDDRASAHICLICYGTGYRLEPECCRQFTGDECGGKNCKGPDNVRVQCSDCGGSGIIE